MQTEYIQVGICAGIILPTNNFADSQVPVVSGNYKIHLVFSIIQPHINICVPILESQVHSKQSKPMFFVLYEFINGIIRTYYVAQKRMALTNPLKSFLIAHCD